MNFSETLTVSAQGEREIVVTRIFNAPRQLVFDANTKPELLKRWLGVRNGWSLAVCEIDLKVGGTYRYLWRNESKGISMGSRGVYREIVPPERFVCTEAFDDPWFPGEALVTTTLVEQAGKTTLSMTMRFELQENRDAVLNSGMGRGLGESYDKLAELLAALGAGGTE